MVRFAVEPVCEILMDPELALTVPVLVVPVTLVAPDKVAPVSDTPDHDAGLVAPERLLPLIVIPVRVVAPEPAFILPLCVMLPVCIDPLSVVPLMLDPLIVTPLRDAPLIVVDPVRMLPVCVSITLDPLFSASPLCVAIGVRVTGAGSAGLEDRERYTHVPALAPERAIKTNAPMTILRDFLLVGWSVSVLGRGLMTVPIVEGISVSALAVISPTAMAIDESGAVIVSLSLVAVRMASSLVVRGGLTISPGVLAREASVGAMAAAVSFVVMVDPVPSALIDSSFFSSSCGAAGVVGMKESPGKNVLFVCALV